MTEVIEAIDQLSPQLGHHLIITDDLRTAEVQAQAHKTHRTKVIMVDIKGLSEKPFMHKKVKVVPVVSEGVNLTDEVAEIIRHW